MKTSEPIDVAVLGTGGIGKRTLEHIEHEDEVTAVAVCDSGGVAVDFDGVEYSDLVAADGGAVAQHDGSEVASLPDGRTTEDSIGDVVDVHEEIDAVVMALPNIPHSFIPDTVERFVEAGYEGVMVDVLKRSRVIDTLEEMEPMLEDAGVTFVCGAGATPGFLTGAAAVAAQSFVEVDEVEIWWGVGIESAYEENKGTVREDIAHLDGFDIETVEEMSDDEIQQVLDEHDGRLEFHDMEHADDRLLEKAGFCSADDVKVGGVLDVTQDEKPTTTTVRVTGTTFDGTSATNTFQLDDSTSMAANVNGPAIGYMKAGVFYNRNGIYGLHGPAELMPEF